MAMVFSWTNGNSIVYTKKLDLVEVAIKNGFIVNVIKDKSHIFKYS